MATQAWPSTLPEPEKGSYVEQPFQSSAIFEPDAGPPTTWRRLTLAATKLSMRFIFSSAQLAAFETFYRTTTLDGSLPFTWTNPRYGASYRYVFDPGSPPQVSDLGGSYWSVSVSLMKVS